MDLSVVGQELLKSLRTDDHILEEYIYEIDENLDDNSTLRSIGERIGIYIPYEEYASEFLPLTLNDFLQEEKDSELSRRIIEMSPDDYEQYLISLSSDNVDLPREVFYPLYANRLLESLKIFKK